MIFIESNSKDAAYNFSIEEHFTRNVKLNRTVFMIWHVDKCIMLGNNQMAEAEVNLSFTNERGIPIIRRQSGGGAIYVDEGTVLFTVINPMFDNAQSHMEDAAAHLLIAFSDMGVSVYREGKNDILLDGKKIVGMAQFSAGSNICTHASLLFDTDLDTLTKILIPHDDKLIPKGIRSIRSRVANIKPYMKTPISTEEFRVELKDKISHGGNCTHYELTPDDLSQIERIYKARYGENEQ